MSIDPLYIHPPQLPVLQLVVHYGREILQNVIHLSFPFSASARRMYLSIEYVFSVVSTHSTLHPGALSYIAYSRRFARLCHSRAIHQIKLPLKYLSDPFPLCPVLLRDCMFVNL